MKCNTCKYIHDNFCAVNPTHCKSRHSKACKECEYAPKEEIEFVCGNCIGMSMGRCTLTHASVEVSDKGCWNFMSQEDADELELSIREEEEYKYELMSSKIRIKLLLVDGNLKELALLK